MELRALVKETAQMLDAAMEEEAGGFFLTVHVSDVDEDDDEDEDERTQMVFVEPDEEGELVVITTDVGPFSDDMDLPEVLRLMRDAVFCRVYVGEAGADSDEQLVVEATAVKAKLDAELLASMIQEVAEVADELELLLFDEDDEEGEDDEEEDDPLAE